MKKKILEVVSSLEMLFTNPPIVALAVAGVAPINLDVVDCNAIVLAETVSATVPSSIISGAIGFSSIIPTALNDYDTCMKERFMGEMSWN